MVITLLPQPHQPTFSPFYLQFSPVLELIFLSLFLFIHPSISGQLPWATKRETWKRFPLVSTATGAGAFHNFLLCSATECIDPHIFLPLPLSSFSISSSLWPPIITLFSPLSLLRAHSHSFLPCLFSFGLLRFTFFLRLVTFSPSIHPSIHPSSPLSSLHSDSSACGQASIIHHYFS